MKYGMFLVLLVSFSCTTANDNAVGDPTKGLKDHYKHFFPIGVSVSPTELKSEEADLVLKEFNSITPVNAMKMKPIHPEENAYYWRDADSIVAFAKRNGLKMRGHVLVWHQEMPDWLLKDSATGKAATKEQVLQRIKQHITTVVNRYKGSIYAWDVVNEVISDDKNEFYRPSELYKLCGEDFIFKAFEFAHAADPNAVLFYNDYNETDPVKRARIIQLIKKMKARGIPVHAIGLQAHWSIYDLTRTELEKTLKDFISLGLPLQITELDMSIYPRIVDEKKLSTDTTFSAEKQKRQAAQYKMCFELFRKYKKHITGVTFWNVSDKKSWLDNFPVKNRKDHPLLFDTQLKRKRAYYEVSSF
jgi:endo-1,4-beta-xylanase